MFFIDPLYIVLLAPAVILSLVAQGMVSRAFNKYRKVRSSTGLTGAEAASRMLRANGIVDVGIEPTQGMLSDHYDPSRRC